MVLSWLLSLWSPGILGSKRSHSEIEDGSDDDAAERLEEEEKRVKRLRMIGLFNNEECTEDHFDPDRLQSTAELLFSKGVLARERGEDASALEYFRVSALAGSTNSIIELARYYLSGTVCSKDVMAAQGLLRAASNHSFVDSELLRNCENEVAEMTKAKLPRDAIPNILKLSCSLTNKSTAGKRLSAGEILSELVADHTSDRLHWLVRLLGSENDTMQEVVADALYERAVEDQGDAPNLAACPGLIEALVGLLASARANAAAKRSAAAVLQLLADAAKSGDKILAVPGSVDALTSLLWTGHAGLQDVAAGALHELARGIPPRALVTIAAEPGKLQRLVTFLGSSNSEMHKFAAWALASLALDTGTGKAIVAVPGSIEHLGRLLGSYSWTVQENAARALANLALEPSNSRAIARAPGALAGLVPLLSHRDARVRRRAARALVNLTCDEDNRARVADAPGALSALARLLSCESAALQKFGAWAIGNLAHGTKLSAQNVAAPGCLRGLVALLDSRKAKVKGYAARALANLARGTRSKKTIASVPGSLEGLVRLEMSRNAEVRAQAKRAIKKLGTTATIGVAINAARWQRGKAAE